MMSLNELVDVIQLTVKSATKVERAEVTTELQDAQTATAIAAVSTRRR